MDASEPEVDRGLPQLSNLNSGSIAVEVSIFYNSAAAAVNKLHNVILGIAKIIIGVKGRAVIGRIVHGNDIAGCVIAETEDIGAAAGTHRHAYKKAAVVIIVC